MTQSQRKRKRMMIKRRQAILKKRAVHNAIFNGIMIMFIMSIGLYITVNANQNMQPKVNKSETSIDYHLTAGVASVLEKGTNQSSNIEEVESVKKYPEFKYSKDWDAKDSYLLAKIAMAEAEGCSTKTKTLIIMSVLNRVWSDDFPNTIKGVIFQKNQFSPIDNGRWDRVEPNEDCYKAVKIVMEAKYDYSEGALYFESCENEDNWHSRNLKFLYQSQEMRFYK